MRARNIPRAATHYLQSLEDTWRSCQKALVTCVVKVVRGAAAPPSRRQSPACPYSHGSEQHQTHSHLVYKTSLWSFCWVPEMIRPLTKSFSSISLIFEIKVPSEGGWTTRAADPEAENAKRVIHRGTGVWVSDDPTGKTGCDLGLLTDWVSRVLDYGKKPFNSR